MLGLRHVSLASSVSTRCFCVSVAALAKDLTWRTAARMVSVEKASRCRSLDILRFVGERLLGSEQNNLNTQCLQDVLLLRVVFFRVNDLSSGLRQAFISTYITLVYQIVSVLVRHSTRLQNRPTFALPLNPPSYVHLLSISIQPIRSIGLNRRAQEYETGDPLNIM